MHEVASVAEATAILRESGARAIGIDGAHGVGKSTLARGLGKALGVPVYSLDNYLQQNRGGFQPFLNCDSLLHDVGEQPAFILEGVCLRQVAKKCGIELGAHVYVKEFQYGYWRDQIELDVKEPIGEFLAKKRKLMSRIEGGCKVEKGGLWEEIIRYHCDARPHRLADIIFRRE